MAWSRLTFWGVFAAFVLNILQPGYMQFYDVRKPVLALFNNLKTAPSKIDTQPQVATKQPTPQPTPTPQSTCQPPKNDYERLLFAQNIGGCDARGN